MIEKRLGKLSRVDPRTVWAHEALEFTPWLASNLPELNEALGIEIELVDKEVSVGNFAVDIFGRESGSGREVIIENQLEATDHGHLGQLLTYAAGLDAKIVVWISPQFRDEHKQALDWLNRDTTEAHSFFGVELELFQIGDSVPAPNFKVVARPSEWQRHVTAATKGEYSERQLAYHEFFEDLLNRLKERHPGFTTLKQAGFDNWLSFAAGRAGFGFPAEFMRPNWFRVQLYIDTGDKESSKRAFDLLLAQKDKIESELGEPLEWLRLNDRRACRIFLQREGNIGSPPDVLEGLKQWAVSQLPKFKEVFGRRLRELDLAVSAGEGLARLE